MVNKDIRISIPFKLAGKLSKRIKEVGFPTITSYVTFVLEQTLESSESLDDKHVEEDEKKVRERLKELGYL